MIEFSELTAQLNFDQVVTEVNKGVNESLQVIYNKVYDECPVNTGYMRSTIGIDNSSNSVYIEANYATYTEYRTGWFTQAIMSAVPGIQATMNIK